VAESAGRDEEDMAAQRVVEVNATVKASWEDKFAEALLPRCVRQG
jgi:hypothetical protein